MKVWEDWDLEEEVDKLYTLPFHYQAAFLMSWILKNLVKPLFINIPGTVNNDAEVEEWEAELEGELNEFEIVSSKDGNENAADDLTEDQIQEMLDAEDGTSSNDSLTRKWG